MGKPRQGMGKVFDKFMMESSKAFNRRWKDPRFFHRWVVGSAIDIGCGDDPLSERFYPGLTEIKSWDRKDGDAMLLDGVKDESYDVVYSSHCLEHLVDPVVALKNWIRVCRIGGHIIVTVPDEDLYEQKAWPSEFNPDHRTTFTILKEKSWSPVSYNVMDLLLDLSASIRVLKIELLDTHFDYKTEKWDQTLGESESGIEIVMQRIA